MADSSRHIVALELAHALLGGPWRYAACRERAIGVLAANPTWLRPVLVATLRHFRHQSPRGEPSVLAAYLRSLPSFARPGPLRHPWLESLELSSPTGPWQGAPIPQLATVGDVSSWLGVPAERLPFYAEPWRHRRAQDTALAPYRYRWVPKRHGRARLLEIPRPRLRAMQRRILDELLRWMPVHEACHGFVGGRGVKSFAAQHARREVVLALDLQDFFVSVPRGRVFRVFRALGYPEQVSRILAGLCTTRPPRSVLGDAPAPWSSRLDGPHLPQGAPTSPALANLCAFRFDVRVAALARSAGVTYTRYADDLAFSGDAQFGRSSRRFTAAVASIGFEEGFALNHRKSRQMRACAQQRLAGVVVNAEPRVSRAERERLEAILFNCVKHGPTSQNRDARPNWREHLLGRIAWVEHLRPADGKRLRELYTQIAWG